jgi:hypothetical protein
MVKKTELPGDSILFNDQSFPGFDRGNISHNQSVASEKNPARKSQSFLKAGGKQNRLPDNLDKIENIAGSTKNQKLNEVSSLQ